jgi:hypothetical protein
VGSPVNMVNMARNIVLVMAFGGYAEPSCLTI